MSIYFEPRTFGYAYYPYLRPYEHYKLVFRSKECIFLRYSNQEKKGMVAYIMTQVFVSRHVVFDEETFP